MPKRTLRRKKTVPRKKAAPKRPVPRTDDEPETESLSPSARFYLGLRTAIALAESEGVTINEIVGGLELIKILTISEAAEAASLSSDG